LNRSAVSARLMSGAVHEVNNALQVIAGSLELLEQQVDLTPSVVKSLDRLKRHSERAARALAELQVFTKAGLEGTARFSVRDVVAHAISLRRYAASRAGLAFEVDDTAADSGLANGNPGYVEQALLNLLMNAEQAMADAPGTIRVRIVDDGSRIGVEVVDTGRGIAPDLVPHLFEPFASTHPPAEGAGLGLWTAKTIADAAGGSVHVASANGTTTATLWLPRGEIPARP
jgi:signal transduction histidine kinase